MNIIVDKMIRLYEYFRFSFRILIKRGKQCSYILETPIHANIGDSAIAYAQKVYLNNIGINNLIEINQRDCAKFKKVLKLLVRKRDLIFLHGGGNMGIEWFHEELARRYWITTYPHSKIISFPQTIYYGDSDKGLKELNNSINIYNKHKHLVLTARENTSYDIMREIYKNCLIIKTPDIVMSLKNIINVEPKNRSGILYCFRNDAEKNINEDFIANITNFISNKGEQISYTDMIYHSMILNNREDIIFEKLNEFSKYKIVITDRLHAMVFCYLTKTPCIVFGNYNYKVSGNYEWIKECNYIHFLKNHDDFYSCYDELINITSFVDKIISLDDYKELEKSIKE